MVKNKKITVDNVSISITEIDKEDYICLTDMVKGEEGGDHIRNWMRNRNTVEYLGIWEQLYNPNFKGVEFDTFKKEAGLNTFNLTPRKWVENTDAIGIISKSGRNGGTYAHKDIAFEFGAWISPMFKLLLIKEFQRLKKAETDLYNLEWNVKRILSKTNYHIHTDAVLKHIIPKSSLPENKKGIEYAKEADLLNLALFGCTAKEWRDANPNHSKNKLNIRDFASINELTVLSNLESFNAEMIKNNISKTTRFHMLKNMAKDQLKKLKNIDIIKAVRKQSNKTYIEAQEKTGDELEKETQTSILQKNRDNLAKFKKIQESKNKKS